MLSASICRQILHSAQKRPMKLHSKASSTIVGLEPISLLRSMRFGTNNQVFLRCLSIDKESNRESGVDAGKDGILKGKNTKAAVYDLKAPWQPDWRDKVLEGHRELQESVKIQEAQIRNDIESRKNTFENVKRALVGNVCIAGAKLAAWMSCGSSAMLSEFVHSLVDCGNQALLLVGLHESDPVADRRHPYGYGKNIYFWSLVSALGTFWLGAGVSLRHSIEELIDPSLADITWQVWGVLGFSLVVDGWVFGKTIQNLRLTQPENVSLFKHIYYTRDPATLAVLLEDGAACFGVVLASTGLCLTQVTGMTIYDGVAGVSISLLLGGMGLALARMNQKFLLGSAVDANTLEGIEKILLRQPAIDNVHSVQSQWIGPNTFSYKAEVDIDGTYLAAKLLPRYQKEFLEIKSSLDEELKVLLSWYAEDVMRTVEREVRHIENEIRKEYPGAAFIELEPDSKDSNRFAIDDGMEAALKRIEIESLNRMLKILFVEPSKHKPETKTLAQNDEEPKK